MGDRFHLDRLDRDVRVVGIVRPNSSDRAAFVGDDLVGPDGETQPFVGPTPDLPSAYQRVGFDIPDDLDPELVLESTQRRRRGALLGGLA